MYRKTGAGGFYVQEERTFYVSQVELSGFYEGTKVVVETSVFRFQSRFIHLIYTHSTFHVK